MGHLMAFIDKLWLITILIGLGGLENKQNNVVWNHGKYGSLVDLFHRLTQNPCGSWRLLVVLPERPAALAVRIGQASGSVTRDQQKSRAWVQFQDRGNKRQVSSFSEGNAIFSISVSGKHGLKQRHHFRFRKHGLKTAPPFPFPDAWLENSATISVSGKRKRKCRHLRLGKPEHKGRHFRFRHEWTPPW